MNRQGEGIKDRPCVIVLAVEEKDAELTVTTVLPVTHSMPSDPAAAVEIPRATKQRLGLDDARSWVMVSEGNSFIWPGPDLRPVANSARFDYGFCPPALFQKIQARFQSYFAAKRLSIVPRTE